MELTEYKIGKRIVYYKGRCENCGYLFIGINKNALASGKKRHDKFKHGSKN